MVSDGIISIALTKEYEARQEFFVKNGDGDFCVQETNPPILKWINIVVTFCNVDPEMVNIMTAEPTVLNDAVAPSAVGFSTQEGSAANCQLRPGGLDPTDQHLVPVHGRPSSATSSGRGWWRAPSVTSPTRTVPPTSSSTPVPRQQPVGYRSVQRVLLREPGRLPDTEAAADTDHSTSASAPVHHQVPPTDRKLRLHNLEQPYP